MISEKVITPNCFSAILGFLPQKVGIMKVYKSGPGKDPFPRSPRNVEDLVSLREIPTGVKYAEHFEILK